MRNPRVRGNAYLVDEANGSHHHENMKPLLRHLGPIIMQRREQLHGDERRGPMHGCRLDQNILQHTYETFRERCSSCDLPERTSEPKPCALRHDQKHDTAHSAHGFVIV